MAARFVLRPESLDVVVASNLFGNILTDIGGAITGSLGLAASGNIDPLRRYPSMFEPVTSPRKHLRQGHSQPHSHGRQRGHDAGFPGENAPGIN